MSDFLVGSLIAPIYAACYNLNTCDLYLKSVFEELFLYESIFNLCATTLDRYIAIVHLLKYSRYMSATNAVRMIAIVWAIPLANFGLHFTWMYAGHAKKEKGFQIFTILEPMFMVALPSLLLLIANARIVKVARLQAKRTMVQLQEINFNKRESNSASSCERSQVDIVSQKHSLRESSAMEMGNNSRKLLQRGRLKRSSIKVVIAVVTIFLICWSLSVYASFCTYLGLCKVLLTFGRLSWLFVLFNSAINPIVFILFKSDMRAELKSATLCEMSNFVEFPGPRYPMTLGDS